MDMRVMMDMKDFAGMVTYMKDLAWAGLEERPPQYGEYSESGVCCLCGGKYTHFGNNPYPLCDEDDFLSRCCDICNWTKVIQARGSGAYRRTEQQTASGSTEAEGVG